LFRHVVRFKAESGPGRQAGLATKQRQGDVGRQESARSMKRERGQMAHAAYPLALDGRSALHRRPCGDCQLTLDTRWPTGDNLPRALTATPHQPSWKAKREVDHE